MSILTSRWSYLTHPPPPASTAHGHQPLVVVAGGPAGAAGEQVGVRQGKRGGNTRRLSTRLHGPARQANT